MRRRRVLDIGLSPRLTRQASDLKLRQNEVTSGSQGFAETKGGHQFPHLNPRGSKILSVKDCGLKKQDSNSNVDHSIPSKATGSKAQCSGHIGDVSNGKSYRLRRPTAFPVSPVVQNGALFHLLVKGKELKPLGIAHDKETCAMFYATHFPLLLRKLLETSEAIPAKRIMTELEAEEQIKLSERLCRARQIRDRLEKAEDILRHFETDPEDSGPIETELRTDLFNPAAWSWNLQRYSLNR